MSDPNTSEVPILPGPSRAQSTPGAGTSPPYDTSDPTGLRFEYKHANILEYHPPPTGKQSAPKAPRFTLELNLAAGELLEDLNKIGHRLRQRGNRLFYPVDGLSDGVNVALGHLHDLFDVCQDIEFKDEKIKKDIEDIIPKLLKHAKMVARKIPEPKPSNGPAKMKPFDALVHLCWKVEEAERDPAKWEDVKETLLEARTPNVFWIASSFFTPYDKLARINCRIQLEAQRAELAETEAELLIYTESTVDVRGDRAILEEEMNKWVADLLRCLPETSVPLAEIRDFYQKYLQGAASEEEVEAYYDDYPFSSRNKEVLKMWLTVLSHALAEHNILTVAEVE